MLEQDYYVHTHIKIKDEPAEVAREYLRNVLLTPQLNESERQTRTAQIDAAVNALGGRASVVSQLVAEISNGGEIDGTSRPHFKAMTLIVIMIGRVYSATCQDTTRVPGAVRKPRIAKRSSYIHLSNRIPITNEFTSTTSPPKYNNRKAHKLTRSRSPWWQRR